MKALVVIDLQKEFINKNTKRAIKEISELIKKDNFDEIIFSQFINSQNNPTYINLAWKGCLTEESQKVCINTESSKIIKKDTYTVLNSEFIDYINKKNIDEIYLCGIDIECCVLTTALNLFENNYNVYVLKKYCYCMSGTRNKRNALEILKRNIGKNRII